MRSLLLSLVAGVFAVNAAWADPPPGKGGASNAESRDGKSKGKNRERSDAKQRDEGDRRGKGDRDVAESQRPPAGVTFRFEDQHRTVVREYYVSEYRSGRCPPGLAKKNNGCMPPGQAKKWRVGQPLPREVIFYDIPPEIVVRVGLPPPGYRYVRVAADILLIAVGTGLVIDAITDLGNL